jgi:hypothetical protein
VGGVSVAFLLARILLCTTNLAYAVLTWLWHPAVMPIGILAAFSAGMLATTVISDLTDR